MKCIMLLLFCCTSLAIGMYTNQPMQENELSENTRQIYGAVVNAAVAQGARRAAGLQDLPDLTFLVGNAFSRPRQNLADVIILISGPNQACQPLLR